MSNKTMMIVKIYLGSQKYNASMSPNEIYMVENELKKIGKWFQQYTTMSGTL